MNVSICVPTYNRPELLRECLESCIRQTLTPHEILVGDDSRDDRSAAVVEELAATAPCPIRYFHNTPSLGQGGNVHNLLQQASAELLCLIHDDDLLADRALEVLVPCFQDPTIAVAFGKQYVITHEGEVDEHRTQAAIRDFFKLPENAGPQPDFLVSAIVQQFPNNGFVIRTDLAKEVGYAEPYRLMGDGCDHAFSLFCALKRPDMRPYFVDEFTASYRLSQVSISRGAGSQNNAFLTFQYLAGLDHPALDHPLVHPWMASRTGIAINQACVLGRTREAWSIYLSKWHRGKILTPRGLMRLTRILTTREKA